MWPCGQTDYSKAQTRGVPLFAPGRLDGKLFAHLRAAPRALFRVRATATRCLPNANMYVYSIQMRLQLRAVLWLACTCLVLCGHVVAAGELSLSGDLDGDGKRDRVTFDRSEPCVLKVWLSAGGTTWTVRSQTPIVRVVVKDLDGDHRAELIARGKAPGLLVWTTRKHKGFRAYRPRRNTAPSMSRSSRHAFREDGAGSTSDAVSAGSSALALLISNRPRAPTHVTRVLVQPATPSLRRTLPLDVFAPRPPPTTL